MFKKIEFPTVTAFLVYVLYKVWQSTSSVIQQGYKSGFDQQFKLRGIPFHYPDSYYRYFLYPQLTEIFTVYLSFIIINFIVVPRFVDKKLYTKAAIYTSIFALATWFFISFAVYLREGIFEGNHITYYLVNGSWALYLLLWFAAYIGLKKIIIFYLKPQRTLGHEVFQKIFLVALVWIVTLILLKISHVSGLAFLWACTLPLGLPLFLIDYYWLIPRYYDLAGNRSNYYIRLTITAVLVCLAFDLLKLGRWGEGPLLIIAFWLVETAIVVVFAHYLYNRNRERLSQLLKLKQDLSGTSARLDMLRSQINPHFLFNSLNTLYGTAMQEHSDRTATGIQQLADMMRFMLHENQQDKIPLNREVEYLQNYIQLQSLRIEASADIKMGINIQEEHQGYQIAPMLLIPFVENAFKHGISLEHASFITVMLKRDGNQLRFCVNNSVHQRAAQQKPNEYSGVGLQNVKQRLELLYKGKYQLEIHAEPDKYTAELHLEL